MVCGTIRGGFWKLRMKQTPPLDIGDRQFLCVARLNPSMGIPEEGHVENSEGQIGRTAVASSTRTVVRFRRHSGRWRVRYRTV